VKYKNEYKKKTNEILNNEVNLNEKFALIKNILNSLDQILEIFYPILEIFYSMEEAKTYYKNGTLDKLSELLFTVSHDCKKLTDPSFNSELYKKILNLSN